MIGTAQLLFVLLYILNFMLVINIYRKASKVPWFALAMMSVLAYRVHSIFVLRMFNDAVAMAIAYAAMNAFVYNHWTLGCILYSLAVSVKMNVLLFAPGLLVVLLLATGLRASILRIAICGLVQLILGLPFLMGNPLAYLLRSFEFQRQFFYKWTVNWRVLPEWLFLDRRFHFVLLLCHLTTLSVFAFGVWLRGRQLHWKLPSVNLSANEIVNILFISNFVGVAFARSLHYQFYIWYFHTLPFLIWSTGLPTPIKVALPLVVEWCWNVYPSTVASSATLHAMHLVLLTSLVVFSTQPLPKERKVN
jgi:alpha-1,3-mannosyltransferase